MTLFKRQALAALEAVDTTYDERERAIDALAELQPALRDALERDGGEANELSVKRDVILAELVVAHLAHHEARRISDAVMTNAPEIIRAEVAGELQARKGRLQ